MTSTDTVGSFHCNCCKRGDGTAVAEQDSDLKASKLLTEDANEPAQNVQRNCSRVRRRLACHERAVLLDRSGLPNQKDRHSSLKNAQESRFTRVASKSTPAISLVVRINTDCCRFASCLERTIPLRDH